MLRCVLALSTLRAARPGAATLLAGLCGLLAATPARAAPGDPAGCSLLWRVQVQLDAVPRQLRLSLAFDAGGRSTSTLRLPGGWAGLVETTGPSDTGTPTTPEAQALAPRLQAVANAPLLRRLAHAPAERVRLAWRLAMPDSGPAGAGVQLAASWFAFSGTALLPMPDDTDDRPPASACLLLTGLPADSQIVSSHGTAEGSEALFRVAGGAAPLAVRVQQALVAGGDLWVHRPVAPASAAAAVAGPPLTVAMPRAAAWRFGIETLAQASARALAAQRRYWGDVAPGMPWLVLLVPDPGAPEGTGAAAWHQALALQAPADLAIPGAAFDGLITEALARAWVAERFGPLAHAGRGDEGLRAWYSEGWADFLAHRALLREGQWTPDDYAAALNRKVERALDAAASAGQTNALPGTTAATLSAARGEWLALRWHAALRAAGRPGLEALLQRLQVPATQARREGPISAPLATHRVLAALRPVLGDAALGDLARMMAEADFFRFEPTALGPCFTGQPPPTQLRAQVPGDGGASGLNDPPAAEPLRALPRYRPVPQAMQRPACLGWLGLGPEAARAAASGQASTASDAAGPAGSKAKAGSKGQPKPKTGAAGSGKSSGKATSKTTGQGASPRTGQARPKVDKSARPAAPRPKA